MQTNNTIKKFYSADTGFNLGGNGKEKEVEKEFSEWIESQSEDLMKAGDGYDALPNSSKKCIDYAIIRYNKYLSKPAALSHPTTTVLDSEELWDEFAEMIDDDIDSLQYYAGRNVITQESFKNLMAKIQPSTVLGWVDDAELISFAQFIQEIVSKQGMLNYPSIRLAIEVFKGKSNSTPTPANEIGWVDAVKERIEKVNQWKEGSIKAYALTADKVIQSQEAAFVLAYGMEISFLEKLIKSNSTHTSTNKIKSNLSESIDNFKWSELEKIASPDKWIKMYSHYQELLNKEDVAGFWHEQFNIASAERNELKSNPDKFYTTLTGEQRIKYEQGIESLKKEIMELKNK